MNSDGTHSDHSARRALYVAPFDELADPLLLIDLAVRAEARGWDGLFLWDHIAYGSPGTAVADPWVALSAIAARTQRLLLGPMVTPLSRRRVQKVARETATLDQLSRGRLILGVGLGANDYELEPYGDVVDPRERARRLDEGLSRLAAFWSGEFEPRPVQQPRIPVWVAGRWPHRRPVARAAAWDGLFPTDLPDPDALRQLAGEIQRPHHDRPFDLVVEVDPGSELEPWREAGATWILTGFGHEPKTADVQDAIDAGPG